MGADTNEKG
jgi:hypothetical protein